MLAIAWLSLAVVAWYFYTSAVPTTSPWIAWLTTIAVGLVGTILSWFLSQRGYRDLRDTAELVESRYPSLQQRLLTAVELPDVPRGERRAFLQQQLIDQTLRNSRMNDWERIVPVSNITFAWICQFATLLIAAFAIVGMGSSIIHRNSSSAMLADVRSKFLDVEVEPGDTEVERGSHLVVTARFGGEVPRSVWLESRTGVSQNRSEMRRSLQDPLYGGFLGELDATTDYRVVYDREQTRWFRAEVFEYPRLDRSDLEIDPPAYSGQSHRRIENTMRASVPEGTTVHWQLFVNKPLQRTSLIQSDGQDHPASQDADNPLLWHFETIIQKSERWRVRLVDVDGRLAKVEPELSVRIIPNNPPTIKLARASDVQVSPLEELRVSAKFDDDFGLIATGLSYSLDGKPAEEVLLGSGGKKSEGVHDILLEDLQAEPDQLLSYYFWAEDRDSEGNVRRIESDLFFAEVRPWEEIFREGAAPIGGDSEPTAGPQNGMGAGEQAQSLAELQKQILTATWNVLRAQRRVTDWADDVSAIRQSQQDALDQSQALLQQASDESSLKMVEEVQSAMRRALEHLSVAVSGSESRSLRDAVPFEHSAYSGLLRLRAREFEVSRSQDQRSRPSASRSGAQQQRQQQLEQLELRNQEQRYQQESTANPQQDSEQREMRQVMNRLKELAQRQQDMNQQLKELEAAIQQESNAEEKRKLEEQLKRLRDAQRELLQDADELLDRMEDASSSEAMEQAKQQVEQARENVRQSSEALDRQQISPAIASGSRAQQQLEETRETLRQESANQFAESMTQLTREAQEVSERQQSLQQMLMDRQERNRDPQQGLRPNVEGSDLPEQLAQQKEHVDSLLQHVQETVEQAEGAEPILADKLYDAFRETRQSGTTQKLDQTRQLIDRGLEEPASRVLQQATEAIEQLRAGIEEAAQGVLGSRSESLRRALRELEEASQAIEREANRLGPKDRNSESQNEGNGSRKLDDPRQSAGEGNVSENNERGNDVQQPESSEREPQQGSADRDRNQREGARRGQNSDENQLQDQSSDGRQNRNETPDADNAHQTSAERSPDASGSANLRDSPVNNLAPNGRDGSRGGWLERFAESERLEGPLTGQNFTGWADLLRDAEELVEDPELQSRLAQIREVAREMRREFNRHSKEPQWPLVQRLIIDPLREVQKQVHWELLRQTAEQNALVPVDRDPVPPKFERAQQEYYERLGSGR